jgi:hypothetical protein
MNLPAPPDLIDAARSALALVLALTGFAVVADLLRTPRNRNRK